MGASGASVKAPRQKPMSHPVTNSPGDLERFPLWALVSPPVKDSSQKDKPPSVSRLGNQAGHCSDYRWRQWGGAGSLRAPRQRCIEAGVCNLGSGFVVPAGSKGGT